MTDYQCPLLRRTSGIGDDDRPWFSYDPCKASLDLVWSFSLPVTDEDGVIIGPMEAADSACASAWRVECGNGHVLAVSGGPPGDETADYAEGFEVAAIVKAIGALPRFDPDSVAEFNSLDEIRDSPLHRHSLSEALLAAGPATLTVKQCEITDPHVPHYWGRSYVCQGQSFSTTLNDDVVDAEILAENGLPERGCFRIAQRVGHGPHDWVQAGTTTKYQCQGYRAAASMEQQR